ncbi:MAG: exodeoxyribonuclease VII small subunit [Candidatus Eisenbacteria bacterium]|uniref:Exodeoxyribonuclease 7 small subunit n=1 Tax=Eiseniibacteriota bacterium TaxID=2212470 RepID=A0A7Y2E9H7_UNCEI|nr:exodeoxyribonuclease VII small subunit [Candidatus Eisenbacteria bacterium]
MSSKSTRGKKKNADETPSFEEAMEELEELVEQLEQGEVTLDQSVKAYVRGMSLVKQCMGRLQAAEATIKQLAETDEGFELDEADLGQGELDLDS